jgi:hypothetical protein
MGDVRSFQQSFLLQFIQMHIVKFVSYRDHPIIKAAISRFVSADQQDRRPQRIKSVEYANGSALALNPQLPHMRMPRVSDPRRMGKAEVGTLGHKQFDREANGVLIGFA